MPPLVDESPPPILSVRVLLFMLAACLGGSWFMVPKRSELIERLFKDKQYERVVAVLQDDVHGMKSGQLNGLQHLSASQLTSLSRLLNLTPREQLHSIFTAKNAPAYDAYVHNIALAAVRFVDVLPPAEAYDIIAPAAPRVPEEFRVSLMLTVAHNAHAVNRPDIAANALGIATKCPSATWQIAREMAESYRWSGQPAVAARELHTWLSSHRSRLSEAEVEEAHDLSFALALESGNPGEAFNICLLELKDADDAKDITPELMETSLSLALQSSRTKEMIPWLKKVVDAMPEMQLPLAEVHQQATADHDRFAKFIHWATPLSRWSDWSDDFDTAFDYNLRLSVLGDKESRDRCVEIYDFLGRTEECCEMLLTLGDVKEKPELDLLVARQLAELGHDDEAKVRFENWLKSHPNDRDAHFNYACLLEDMGDEDGSRKAFEQMLTQFPDDVPGIKRLAAACIRDADYSTALALYARLPEKAHDHDTLESYAMIAESLDDHAAELQALLFAARQTDSPTVELYLDLAETASYLPDAQKPLEVLHEGLKRLPKSAQLRIALATQYLNNEQPEDALMVLTDDSLKNNYDAVQVLLGMSESIGDARRALAFLGPDVEKRFNFSSDNRLQLAVLYFNAGQGPEADRLFATVPETPDHFMALADARYHTGSYDEAARLMMTHLKTHPSATAEEWLFLGDLYEEMGRFDDARKAYDYSLALLTANLPDTAANTPRSSK